MEQTLTQESLTYWKMIVKKCRANAHIAHCMFQDDSSRENRKHYVYVLSKLFIAEAHLSVLLPA